MVFYLVTNEWQAGPPPPPSPPSHALFSSFPPVSSLSPRHASSLASWMSSIQKHFPKSPIASRTSLQIMYQPTNKGTNDFKMIKYAKLGDHSKADFVWGNYNHGPTGCQGTSFIQINRLHSAIFPLWKFLTEESYVLLVSNRRSGCGQSCDCVDHSRRFVCGSVRCPTRNCVSSAAAVVLGHWLE